jgi:hypothetical protein
VNAIVQFDKDLPRRLAHWTLQKIDGEIDARVYGPGALPIARAAKGLYLQDVPTGGHGWLKQGGDSNSPSTVSISVEQASGRPKTAVVLPVEAFQEALEQTLSYDPSGVLWHVAESVTKVIGAPPAKTAVKVGVTGQVSDASEGAK